MTHGDEPPYDPFGPEGEYVTPQTTVRVCIECGGLATHALNGTRYCFDHYREQSTVLMGLMQQQRGDEERDDDRSDVA